MYYLAVYEINVTYIFVYNVGERHTAEQEEAGEPIRNLNIIFHHTDTACMSK